MKSEKAFLCHGSILPICTLPSHCRFNRREKNVTEISRNFDIYLPKHCLSISWNCWWKFISSSMMIFMGQPIGELLPCTCAKCFTPASHGIIRERWCRDRCCCNLTSHLKCLKTSSVKKLCLYKKTYGLWCVDAEKWGFWRLVKKTCSRDYRFQELSNANNMRDSRGCWHFRNEAGKVKNRCFTSCIILE